MHNEENRQNNFLGKIVKERTQVIIYTMNGYQMKGVITGFDDFAILVFTDGKVNMVYKHAISTIVPAN